MTPDSPQSGKILEESVSARNQTQQQNFCAIADNAATVLLVVHDSRFLYANHQACLVSGYSQQELLAIDPWSMIHPEDCARVREAMMPLLASQSADSCHLEYRALRKDGSIFWVESHVSLIEFDGKKSFLASELDVSERKAIELRYRAQIDHALYGICLSTPEGRFLEVNPALVRMLGYDSAAELLQRSLPKDVWADPAERELLLHSGEKGSFQGLETDLKRKDGSRITVRLSGRFAALLPNDEKTLQLIVEDVTERKALATQLLHTQKMEAVGRLAGGIAHDFNNLLTVILNCNGMMLGSLPPNSRLRGEAEEIGKAATRAATLTRQLLTIEKHQSLAPKPLDLNQVLREIEGLIHHLIGKYVRLELLLDDDLATVIADGGQIEQVLLNLAVNARDAMQGRGRFTIRSRNALRTFPRNDGAENEPQPGVLLEISDSGCGMPAETLAHIYDPFFTTKETGTGLGLSIVYGIMRDNGGQVWAESEPGHGCTFNLWFPAVDCKVEIAPENMRVSAAKNAAHSILLVEDEDGMRHLMHSVFCRAGYNVATAAGCQQAMLLAESEHKSYDLLVTDVELNGSKGSQVARQIRDLMPSIQVLYVSGYPEDVVREWGYIEPETPFLQKPFTTVGLLETVNGLLQRDRDALD